MIHLNNQDSLFTEAVAQRCSMKKGVLRNFAKFTRKHLFQTLFIKKESLVQVFSCELCEISKYTVFTEHLWATVFDHLSSLEELSSLDVLNSVLKCILVLSLSFCGE